MSSTISLLAFAALLTAPLCLAGDVKTDFDPDVDFSRFHTFSFIGGHEIGRTGLLDDPTIRERFKNFISGALETHGLKELPKDEAYSLAVRYWVARKQIQDVTVIEYGSSMLWGGYPPYWTGAWGYSYEEYVVTDYVEGTLVVDLIDPATKELVWRTFLRQKIEDRAKAYAEAKKNLYKAMSAMPPSADQKDKMRQTRAKLAARYK
jgi:Domain of unknown function (DUF4136)